MSATTTAEIIAAAHDVGIPDHMWDGLVLYITKGIEPGGFLWSVLANDLCGSFERADEVNARAMRGWAQFMVWHCPTIARGTAEKVAAWCERGGIEGRTAAKEANA